jgi:hypothetical protein
MKLRIALYCLLGGLPMAIAALGAGNFGWWYLSGLVLAAAFVPIALFGPRSAAGQFGVIAPVLSIVSALCTWTEAQVFLPAARQHALRDLTGSLTMFLLIAIVLALLASALKISKPSDQTVERRSPAAAFAMIVVCGFAYLVFYAVFGGITYQFFTKKYYPDAAQLAASLGLKLWGMQLARGALMTLAVLPAIYTLRMRRWQVALSIGMLIWVAGGLALLLVPNAMMGTTQRMIHIVEIFTQNAPLGIVAGLLLRPKASRRVASAPSVAAASM